ncbi:MAG: 16S rRNA (cytosine(1402)-N(4))-methyltransferase RsmH [Desulfamplus sp.]|nr:16S rRNA (cytosine(1402)-N(4))-methyltransferase RsmH [Desulfamplus sp.]
MQPFTHISVLQEEVCHYLNLKPGSICVDGTLGGCGHARSIIKYIFPNGRFIGIDQDIDAIKNAEVVLSKSLGNLIDNRINIVHGNFSELPKFLDLLGLTGVDAILLDLGLSFHQLMESQRGFSFQKDEFLDMRMDNRNTTTAADIINQYSESALADIFFKYGEERMSKRIAHKIVEKRTVSPITTTIDLVNIVKQVMPVKLLKTQKIHPATRIFQALRIEVNGELEHLKNFIANVPNMLNKGGRLCVISFHSLEDRVVKHSIRSWENGCTCHKNLPECLCGFVPKFKAVVRKPIIPSQKEINLNPLSRSAKLRVAEKL